MSKQSLRVISPVQTTGVAYARGGTAVAAVICLLAWLFRQPLAETPLAQLPQVSSAAVVLGLIGINHVQRRAKRISSLR